MKISKQASLNISIRLWKQSCGAILPVMTPWPTQTYWSLWWMFIITLHIIVLVWHLMMSHLQIKDGYGSDFMLNQCLITLHVGDTVRISKARRVFKKGYLAQWTVKRKSTQPPTFVFADYTSKVLKGTFYPQELQKVNKTDNVYRVEKILRRTKHRVFVKWLSYPHKFNSWVNVKNLVWYFIWLYFCFPW